MDKKPSRRDLLSDLPLSIVHIILSLVSIRDAIRTSLLSRQWRYIWSSLPCLAFDDRCVDPPKEDESDEKRVIHFISHALLLHKGPIHKFKLGLSPMNDSQCIDYWLLFLSRNDIRVLVLEFDCYGSWYEPHSSLYSCQKLTRLKLRVYAIPPPPPSFKGFMFLRSLRICVTELSSSTIETMIALSPLLEKLTLNGFGDPKIKICAPNLKYFSLVSASPCLSLCTPKLEEFKGDLSYTKSFSIGDESFRGCSVFHHLWTIKLSEVPFDNKGVTPSLIRLITGSPNLHQLEISGSFYWNEYNPELDSVSFWDAECAPDLTYDSLKVIKMEGCGGELNEMKLVEFLLARSPVLEKMMYKPNQSLPDLDLLNLMAELLRCRRASVNAEILVCKKWNPSSS